MSESHGDATQSAANAALRRLQEESGLSLSEIGRMVGRVAHTARLGGKQPDSRAWRRWADGEEPIPHPLAALWLALEAEEEGA